jgi:hypothetical protein
MIQLILQSNLILEKVEGGSGGKDLQSVFSAPLVKAGSTVGKLTSQMYG